MSNTPQFLQGGGQLGELIRSTDWSQTSLGSPDTWPDSLRQAISISLNSGFPIAIYWGPEFIILYNDAYSSIPGEKHPWALGKPGAVAWADIWAGLEPEFESVLYRSESIRRPDAMLLMHRYGYTEECYFDYTLSPIIDMEGKVRGVFNAVIETTYRVINNRRIKILQDLQQQLNRAHTLQESVIKIEAILDRCREDIPFYLLFSTANENSYESTLTAHSATLTSNDLLIEWPYETTSDTEAHIHVVNLEQYMPQPFMSIWGEACREAYIIPLSLDGARISGYMVMGVSPRKKLDDDYQHFLSSVAIYAGTILNNGYSYELDGQLQREQALNEELSAANEELGATNEELHQSQQSLAALNAELEDRVTDRTRAAIENEARFKHLIEQSTVAMLVLRGPDMVFDIFNPPMLELIGRTKAVKGKSLFEAMPELKGQPVVDRLYKVFETGKEWKGYEQPVIITRNGEQTQGYYNVSYRALLENGVITGVIQSAIDVTDQVKARKTIEESEVNLRSLVMTAHYALMILRGREWVIEIANQPLVNLWDKTIEDVTGKRLLDVLPEIADQPFPKFLQQVYDSGVGYGQEEEVFYLDTPEGTVKKYVSFYYDPMFDSEGQVTGIIVAAEDITDNVQNRLLLEDSYIEQQSLNEELSATNEELASANEELVTTNEELAQTQESLQALVAQLAESEARIRYMVADAPVAIGILTGRELIIEAANRKLLEVWGKTAEVINMPLHLGLPELEGQPFLGILDNVYTAGKPYIGNEAKVLLMRNNVLEECYFSYVYHPIKDGNGHTISIMVVANEITDQVRARNQVENAEEMLRFSIEAAHLGTWYLDINTQELKISDRLKELFGFNAADNITYDEMIQCIPEEYRAYVENAASKAISSGITYNVEHPTIGFRDQKLRWVRGAGRLNNDTKSGKAYFSGVAIDITEQKQDEQRKNDFIGMVSHELKTPLTSLSAYIQMLHAKARNNGDNFTVNALDKVTIQVKKMTTMINGFLNVSRLESGKIYLEKQDFRLDELLNDMVNETQLATVSHHISLLPSPEVTVTADRDKIGSVISNLLSNAVKYSPRNTYIEVHCTVDNDMALVSVKDQGMGINPQDIEKLFERYYRVDSKHTQTISGFGIGLYLCAEIIQRHDGTIRVESEIGMGSTFSFSLPLA